MASSADAGDPGRPGGHQHGGGQRGPAAGDVQAGPVDRPAQLPDDYAAAFVAAVGAELGPVVGDDAVVGRFEGGAEPRGMSSRADFSSSGRHAEVVDVGAVEARRQLAEGGVPIGADLSEDLAACASVASGSSTIFGAGSRPRRSPATPRRSNAGRAELARSRGDIGSMMVPLCPRPPN